MGWHKKGVFLDDSFLSYGAYCFLRSLCTVRLTVVVVLIFLDDLLALWACATILFELLMSGFAELPF